MEKIFKILCVFIITSSSIYAESDRGMFYKLAENVRSILWKSDPIPDKFELSNEETDRAVAYSELEAEIGDFAYSTSNLPEDANGTDCPDAVNQEEEEDKVELQQQIKQRAFSIYFTGTFNTKEALAQAEGVYGRNNYHSFMTAIASRGNGAAGPINTLTKLEQKYLKTDGAPDNWASLSVLERSQLLQEYATSQVGQDVSMGLILSDYAIGSMVANPANWKSSLNEIKDHLSFDEKMKIASHFGGEFSDRYNYDRANDVGNEGEGIVTIEEMLQSIRTNEPGGICRDVALAQAQILRELGVKKDDIYMIGYATATGGHAVLAVQDPNDPKNIVKLNYSYITEENQVGGGAQLTQDTSLPDVGMNYRVYDADGKPVGRVPTEMGQIFNEVTNGRNDTINKSYALQKAYVETPIGIGTIFSGQTSAGDNVVGVAINGRMEQGLSETEIGVAVAKRDGERTMVTIDQESLYAKMDTRLNTPSVKVGDNFSVNAFGGARAEVMFMNTTVENKVNGAVREGTNVEPMATFYAGVESQWTSDDGRTKVNSEVVAESYLDWKNEVNVTEGQTLALDNVRWTTGVEHGVTDSMRVIGEGTILMRQMGTAAVISGGLQDMSSGLSVTGAYQTPLTGDIPTFMQGGSRAASVGVSKDWREKDGTGPSISFYYQRDLDFENDQVGVSAGWKF